MNLLIISTLVGPAGGTFCAWGQHTPLLEGTHSHGGGAG